MSVNNQLNNLEEQHAATLHNIENLQELERHMYQSLQNLGSGSEQTALEQEGIINRIKELKNIRTSLLQQISATYSDKQDELNDERKDLMSKLSQIGMVESELDRTRKNIGAMENEKNNTLRMVQLYDYERQRYSAYTGVVLMLVYGALVVLALSLLLKYDVIPFVSQHVYAALIGVTIVFTMVQVIVKVADIMSRNNLNFAQYDFETETAKLQPNYQTVYQHDVALFDKLDSDVKGEATQAEAQVDTSVSALKHLSSNLANGTGAGAGVSGGISNDPSVVAKIPGGGSIVLAVESSKESFASF